MLQFQKLLEVHVLSATQTASGLEGTPWEGGGSLQPPGGGQGMTAKKPLFWVGSGPHLKSRLGPSALLASSSIKEEGW